MTLQDLAKTHSSKAVEKRVNDNIRRLGALRKHLEHLRRRKQKVSIVKLEIENLEREIKIDQAFLGR